MKKAKNTLLHRVLALCMALVLAFGCLAPVQANGGAAVWIEQTDAEPLTARSSGRQIGEKQTASAYGEEETVRVSIILEEESTIAAGFSTKNIASNATAMAYRAGLEREQTALTGRISRKLGKELDVVWNLTLAANIISANVSYGDIETIKAVDGVADVILETRYYPAETETAAPNMAVSTGMTGATQVWSSGYTGAGSRIAIIDTGIDTAHQSFDNGAFLYALGENDYDLLDADEIAGVLDQLHADATAEELSISDKIPFGYNYVDGNTNVSHLLDTTSEHGSHVAGIAAANRYIPDGDGYTEALSAVNVAGAAPDAQILVMKVFGENGGAWNSDYMAAIEDAIVLGCDSVNLSLGSAEAGMTTADEYEQIMQMLESTDTVVVMSAGNNSHWAQSSDNGYLYAEDVGFQTLGAPGSYTNALTVASVENQGTVAELIRVGESLFPFTESLYSNAPLRSLAASGDAELEYVFTDGVGQDSDYAGIDLSGKVVFCSRGQTSFAEKANLAASKGAAAVIVYNSVDGDFGMDLTDYAYTVPVAAMLKADAAAIRALSTAATSASGVSYFTGAVTILKDLSVKDDDSSYLTMSGFSSWGVPGSLSIKPEITAPGGNVYSVNGSHLSSDGFGGGSDQYEWLSGTSMAAPQVTGLMAQLMQYIEENGLSQEGLTDRALAQSLLMSTASPIYAAHSDSDTSGYLVSILQQGAGLANVADAMGAATYILMGDDATASAADGKVKAELGDDPEKTGVYRFTFTMNNLTDADQSYTLSSDVFRQSQFRSYPNKVTPEGDLVSSSSSVVVMDTATRELEAEAAFAVDGSALADAMVTVPASGSVTVEVTISLTDLDKREIGLYFENGTYIQAFVHADPVADDEGAVSSGHSIPVLAFYGGWTDASMFDKGSWEEYVHGMETKIPYTYSYNGIDTNSFATSYWGDTGNYFFCGNPYLDDAVYLEERNSLNPEIGYLSDIYYALIRNAAALRVTVTDVETGEIYLERVLGEDYAAYYNPNVGEWERTYNTASLNWAGTDGDGHTLPDGTAVRVTLTAAPEYYVRADGTVDWDALGEGASYSTQLTIDTQAPVVEGAEEKIVLDSGSSLNLTVRDDQYVAAVMLYDSTGRLIEAVNPGETEANARTELTMGEDLVDGVYTLEVADYAENIATYRIFLGTEETSGVESVTVSPASLSLMAGESKTLTATVAPETLTDRSVIWTSSNVNVATVSADGTVTAVGEGEAVITAAASMAPYITGSCTVSVVDPHADLNAVFWDSEGIWFSSFNTADLSDVTHLTAYTDHQVNAVAVAPDGTMYASTMYLGGGYGEIYRVDPATYEMTLVTNNTSWGGFPTYFTDMTYVPGMYGTGALIGIYGSWVCAVNLETGVSEWIDTYDEYLVGITTVSGSYDAESGMSTDFVYLIGTSGTVYQEGYIWVDGYGTAAYTTSMGMDRASFATGLDTGGAWYYNSAYYDGRYLYWSNLNFPYNTSNSTVSLYAIDADFSEEVYKLGEFAPGVLPVAGLYQSTGEAPHEHSYEAVVTAPTCTEGGYTTYTCSCGDSYVADETPALGHAWGEWVPAKEPTYLTEGEETRTCANCGETQTRAVEPLGNPFEDVPDGSWYYDPVMWALENGITTGTSPTTFSPNNECQRAQVVTFLWRAAGSPEPTGTDNPFEDVKPTDFFYKAVLWAVEEGITNGLDAIHFGPYATCNRAQVVTFLWRAKGQPAATSAVHPFTDVQAGSFYYEAMLWAVEKGVTTGMTKTTFGPDGICNRAQIVTFLYRAFA